MAIHGCQNDNVTFFFQGGQHNLVQIATQNQGEDPDPDPDADPDRGPGPSPHQSACLALRAEC